MKKAILFLATALMVVTGVQAQKKVAYLDLYQRGGGQHLKTTIMYDSNSINVGNRNMGEMLNALAAQGWEVDQTLPGVNRHWNAVGMFTPSRHKFHIILKKEYNEGENPFTGLRGLSSTKDSNAKATKPTSSKSKKTSVPVKKGANKKK